MSQQRCELWDAGHGIGVRRKLSKDYIEFLRMRPETEFCELRSRNWDLDISCTTFLHLYSWRIRLLRSKYRPPCDLVFNIITIAIIIIPLSIPCSIWMIDIAVGLIITYSSIEQGVHESHHLFALSSKSETCVMGKRRLLVLEGT